MKHFLKLPCFGFLLFTVSFISSAQVKLPDHVNVIKTIKDTVYKVIAIPEGETIKVVVEKLKDGDGLNKVVKETVAVVDKEITLPDLKKIADGLNLPDIELEKALVNDLVNKINDNRLMQDAFEEAFSHEERPKVAIISQLKSKTIQVFYPKAQGYQLMLNIDSVIYRIYMANIIEFVVFGSHSKDSLDRYRFFLPYPIQLTTKKSMLIDSTIHLRNADASSKEKSKLYIQLSDVISFVPNYNLRVNNYTPANAVVKFSKTELDKPQKLNKGYARNFFRVNLYTDAVGFDSDKPNSLFQTEINAFLPVNNCPLLRTKFTLLKNLAPTLNFTKLTQGKEFLSNNPAYSTTITPLDFYQYSNLNLGARINILSFLNNTFDAFLNYRARIFETNFLDTASLLIPAFRPYYSFTHEFEVVVKYRPNDLLTFDLFYAVILFNSLNPGTSKGVIKRNSLLEFEGKKMLFVPQFQVAFDPQDNKDKRIFARVSMPYLSKGNSALQLEIGRSTSIYHLVKSFSSK